MTLLCRYSELFGAPGTGVHRARLFGLARADVLATAAAAVVVAAAAHARGAAFWRTLGWAFVALVALGWALHMLFCVRTPLTRPFL